MALLNDFREYLMAQGVVRKPSIAGSTPPLWLEPRNGTPAPGESPSNNTTEKSDTVLGAFLNLAGGIPARPYESSMRADTIEVRYRVKTAELITPIERAVRGALLDHKDFFMGTQRVIACDEWRALTRVDSDEQGFEYLSSYVIWQYS